MRVGEWLTGAPHVDFSPVGLKDLILHSSTNLLKSVGRAVLAWVLTWPLLAFGLYLALAPAFQFLRRKWVSLSRQKSLPRAMFSAMCLRGFAALRLTHSGAGSAGRPQLLPS